MKKVIGVILGILGSIVVVSAAWKSFHSEADGRKTFRKHLND